MSLTLQYVLGTLSYLLFVKRDDFLPLNAIAQAQASFDVHYDRANESVDNPDNVEVWFSSRHLYILDIF